MRNWQERLKRIADGSEKAKEYVGSFKEAVCTDLRPEEVPADSGYRVSGECSMVIIFTSNTKGGIIQFAFQMAQTFENIGYDCRVMLRMSGKAADMNRKRVEQSCIIK